MGLCPERIAVIPNMASSNGIEPSSGQGQFVAYVGRVSPEKGISTLIAAATKCPDIPFRIVGSYDRMPSVLKQAPRNCIFAGHLTGTELEECYKSSRIVVLPSLWFEGIPTVLVDSMMAGKPVVASRIGGIPEIVDDGITGLMFEPGNAEDLAEKTRNLWNRSDVCRQMGQAGREKALREYSPDKYYERLMAAYERAIELGPGEASGVSQVVARKSHISAKDHGL